MRTVHVAAAQIQSGGSMAENLKRVEQQAAAAAAVGAEVILFSECALQGYDYDLDRDLLARLAVSADGAECRRVQGFAKKYGIAVALGFFEAAGDQFHNSVLLARPDGTTTVARKHVLTPGEIRAGLTPGPRESTVVEFNGVKIAILICADVGREGLQADLEARGVDYRFVPTGGGGKLADMLHEADLAAPEGRQKYETNRPRVFNTNAILEAKDCPVGFTSANALGPAGRQTCHQGHCMIVDGQRVMRAQIPGTIVLEHMQDQMIHATLNFGGT